MNSAFIACVANNVTMPVAERLLRMSLLVAAGIAVYFATLFLLGFRFADFRRKA